MFVFLVAMSVASGVLLLGLIDVNVEHILTFAQLARRVPRRRRDRPVHVSTIHRWRDPGLHGVRLEAVRVGGGWVTSLEAYQRFVESLTMNAMDEAEEAQARNNDTNAEVEQQLKELGF